MNKKYTFYIILGLAMGVVFGTSLGQAIGNNTLRTAFGVLQVVLNLGWIIIFVVMAVRNSKGKRKLE